MAVKLCPGSRRIARITDNPDEDNPGWEAAWFGLRGARPVGIKRIRLTCPLCKCRIMSSVSTCHDGCCVYHYIPPHKPKGWWKKKRRRTGKRGKVRA